MGRLNYRHLATPKQSCYTDASGRPGSGKMTIDLLQFMTDLIGRPRTRYGKGACNGTFRLFKTIYDHETCGPARCARCERSHEQKGYLALTLLFFVAIFLDRMSGYSNPIPGLPSPRSMRKLSEPMRARSRCLSKVR